MKTELFDQENQHDIAEGIATALELEGLLSATLNGSDGPRQSATALIERQLADMFRLMNYLQATCKRLNDEAVAMSLRLVTGPSAAASPQSQRSEP